MYRDYTEASFSEIIRRSLRPRRSSVIWPPQTGLMRRAPRNRYRKTMGVGMSPAGRPLFWQAPHFQKPPYIARGGVPQMSRQIQTRQPIEPRQTQYAFLNRIRPPEGL